MKETLKLIIDFGVENTKLKLSNKNITDIDFVEGFKNLLYLDLKYNQIKNINTLRFFKKLITLELRYNKIEEIDCLKELTNLKFLDLNSNPIKKEKIEELKKALPNCEIYF
jgi:Leucine-rich repeat (LRR) protein